MLLIGGNLLLARDRITEETERFTRAVAGPHPGSWTDKMVTPPMDHRDRSPNFRPAKEGFRWEGVAHQPYKQDGSAPFKDISRQVLFHEDDLGCELRYFEMDRRRVFNAGAPRARPCGDDPAWSWRVPGGR